MTVRSVILFVRPLLKLFVIAWAILVSKVYYIAHLDLIHVPSQSDTQYNPIWLSLAPVSHELFKAGAISTLHFAHKSRDSFRAGNTNNFILV